MKLISKQLLAIVMVFSSFMLSAQIVLEHSYLSTKQNGPLFYGVKFTSGTKYVNELGGSPFLIDIYNENHSLFKSISLPIDSGFNIYIENISDKLFKMDDGIEVLARLIYTKGTPSQFQYRVKIFDETGAIIFSKDSVTTNRYNQGGQNDNIINFGGNYKLVLTTITGTVSNAVLVYSLPGSLPMMLKPVDKDDQIANAFPNPSPGTVTIPYALPATCQTGEIVFFDVKGVELKRFRVTNQFNTLELENEFENGTYFYQLQSEKSTSGARKMIIIK